MGVKYYILDENNQPVESPIEEWSIWFEGAKRSVAFTDLTESNVLCPDLLFGIQVSTVFIGIDHNFLGRGRPILFETMIFGGPNDGRQWRYATWDEAVAGHEAAVALATD